MAAHALNIAVHVAAGAVGLGLGFVQLAGEKGGQAHRRRGWWFVGATMVVTASAALGIVLFRFMPLFAVLAVLVTYQTVSGIRAVRRADRGPAAFDLVLTLAGVGAGLALLPSLMAAPHEAGSNPTVLWASLGAFATMLAYDLVRFAFPRRWHAHLWEYEHIYKLVASLFGMLSAFVGNVVRWGQPWSQIVPSVVGLLTIAVLMVRRARRA